MAFPIIPKKRSGVTGNPSSLELGELATNTATGELFLGGDGGVMLLNPPTSAGTTVTEHTGDGSTVAFTFTGFSSTADGAYLVSVGGIDQPPSKYSVSSTAGGTLTFVDPPVNGELISIRAIVAGSGGGGGADIGGRAWSSTATYSIGDMVHVSGVFPDIENYVSIQDGNTGNDPYSTSGFWKPLTASAIALHGTPVSEDAPADKNALVFSNNTWQPGVVNAAQLQGNPITGNPFQNGDFLYFNGTEFAGAGINTGNATSLQNQPISNATPVAGDLLKFDGTNWIPFSGAAIQNWNSGTYYYTSDKVAYDGKIWVSTTVGQGNTPAIGSAYWAENIGAASGTPSNQSTPAYWLRITTLVGDGYMPIYV